MMSCCRGVPRLSSLAYIRHSGEACYDVLLSECTQAFSVRHISRVQESHAMIMSCCTQVFSVQCLSVIKENHAMSCCLSTQAFSVQRV